MALPGRGGRGGGRGRGRVDAFLLLSGVPGGLDSPLGTKFDALNRKMAKKINFEKNLVEKNINAENLGKKNSRQCYTIGLTDFLIHYK